MSLRRLGRHRRTLIDTRVWIYHFEQNPVFSKAAGAVLERLEDGRFEGIASELTLLEIIVRPLELERQDVADEYEILLTRWPNLRLEPVTRDVLLEAARLRAAHGLKTPDAIVLATGLQAGATLAVSNDRAWRRVSGIETMLLSEM